MIKLDVSLFPEKMNQVLFDQSGNYENCSLNGLKPVYQGSNVKD
jgi:hypothetical protein